MSINLRNREPFMMSSIAAGSSAAERMNRLADYNVHIIVDDSYDIRGLIWGLVKNLLEHLVKETAFELTFVNNPESGRVENRAGLATMMRSVTPHGTRNILEKLDNIIITELRELWALPIEDVPDRRKLNVIVVLCDLPTDPAPLRSLENSVGFAAKSLADATLPDDRIGIQFVQVGFSRRLSEALKDVVENDDANLAHFTTYMGSMDDQRLWKILLGGVLPTFGRLPDTPRPESHPITVMPALPSPRALAIERATLTSGRDPVFYFPAYLRDGSVQTTDTYDLIAGFTFTGWIFQKDRQESNAYDFFTFYHGPSPLFRASVGERQGNCVTTWFPNISAYPTARDCPTSVWTFVCATHDGSGVRLGFNGHLGNKTFLNRLQLEKMTIGMHASKSISLANVKIYDRVLDESEIHSEYFTSLPNDSGLSHQPGSSSAI